MRALTEYSTVAAKAQPRYMWSTDKYLNIYADLHYYHVN